MTLPPCLDCALSSDEGGIGACPHWMPAHWEAQGYERNWGDAAVMAWPTMEILRRETAETIDYIVLAPHSLRRPLHIYMDKHAGTSWGAY